MTAIAPAALPSEIDLHLLEGFSFACRPECGLCCFTSPRVSRSEEARIRRVAPDLAVVRHEGERCIAARPDGGACQFLRGLRCAVHAVRPAPCREFPVTVHVGARLQATVVLSCPGLDLGPLLRHASGEPLPGPLGLQEELGSVRGRLGPVTERLRQESERRRRKVVRALSAGSRWVEDGEVRRELARRPLLPGPQEYVPEDPPPAADGLERLPMYAEGRAGPVALADSFGGWEALELSPEGGARSLGVGAPPGSLPALGEDARELLSAYLRYFLERDSFLAAVHLEMLNLREGTVPEHALADLHTIASTVIARGAVRSQLLGGASGPIGRREIELGVRATDQDWLDRPTWGARL